jgi:hypothetical protein
MTKWPPDTCQERATRLAARGTVAAEVKPP